MSSPDQASSEKGPPGSSASQGWEKRIIVPTLLAGVVGGVGGILSQRRKAFGVAKLCATYAANLSIVTGCYCGARELTRELRASENGDLLNSVIGGISSGAFLGRLQGGQVGAVRYAVIFACTGTALDYAALRMKSRAESSNDSVLENSQQKSEKKSWWSWPEWAPIQLYDEEAEAKKEQEKQFFAQRRMVKMDKRESLDS
ncbi:uncharacterized protein LOC116248350 [Nymphaea colorata]|nr:uncharacterized protein LOC116248350 [Nymphaea colorata]